MSVRCCGVADETAGADHDVWCANSVGAVPNWVYDVVMALQKWNEEHPQLLFERFDGEFVAPEGCGCAALDHVPDVVKDYARVLAAPKERQ